MAEFYSLEEKRVIQLEALDILRELDRVCKANGLRYYITAGTLLGAVRHGGFIPWDDDIDVAMPRRDFNKLSKIAARELNSGYFYQDARSEPSYPFLFSKIRKDGDEVHEPILADFNIHKGRYIDIFPLDKCPRTAFFAKLFFKQVEFVKIAMIAKKSKWYKSGYEKKPVLAVLALARRLPWFVLRFIRWSTLKFYTLLASGKKLCTVAGTHGYPKETYFAEWFSQSCELSFEGERFPAPKGYCELLSNMYGDYMTMPDESERGGHFKKMNGDA